MGYGKNGQFCPIAEKKLLPYSTCSGYFIYIWWMIHQPLPSVLFREFLSPPTHTHSPLPPCLGLLRGTVGSVCWVSDYSFIKEVSIESTQSIRLGTWWKRQIAPPFMSLAAELEGNPLHTSVDSMKIRPRKVQVNTLNYWVAKGKGHFS